MSETDELRDGRAGEEESSSSELPRNLPEIRSPAPREQARSNETPFALKPSKDGKTEVPIGTPGQFRSDMSHFSPHWASGLPHHPWFTGMGKHPSQGYMEYPGAPQFWLPQIPAADAWTHPFWMSNPYTQPWIAPPQWAPSTQPAQVYAMTRSKTAKPRWTAEDRRAANRNAIDNLASPEFKTPQAAGGSPTSPTPVKKEPTRDPDPPEPDEDPDSEGPDEENNEEHFTPIQNPPSPPDPGGNDGDESDDSDEPKPSPKPVESLSSRNNRITYPTIMQVKAIEMNLTSLTKESIEDFKFKAQIACSDMPNFNPAVWISKPILNKLLKQAKEDITEETKLPNGQPNYAKYTQLTADQLYTKIGQRGPENALIGVKYIAQIMTRCIVDTKHLFQNCLKDFQIIECRGATATLVRGMHAKVTQTYNHWKTTMSYKIESSLAKNIIKSLNNQIQKKLFDTNFHRTLLNNRAECKTQMDNAQSKANPDNDIDLWLAVLDYTLATFEHQLEFAAGPGASNKPAPSKRRAEGQLANIQEVKSKKDVKTPKDSKIRWQDEKNMTCFNCGQKGVKTGHTKCAHDKEPNAAGIQAKKAYREKLMEKKKTKPTLQTIEQSGISDSESESDMCMITAWDMDQQIEDVDGRPPDDPDQMEDVPSMATLETDKPIPVPILGKGKLAIFQDVIVNSREATVLFDTGSLGANGNWISESTAERLGAFLQPAKKKTWKSPLFPDASYVSKSKTALTILFKSFGFEIQDIEFRIMQPSKLKADIILGLEFIEQYDIMLYLTNPDVYHAVDPPPPAEEETIEWKEGKHAFQSAILDLSREPEKRNSLSQHDYRSGINVKPDFPEFDRACSILEKYHGLVLTNSLNESTINVPPMNLTPTKPFLGCNPIRLDAHKKAFLDTWIDRKLKAGIIEPCSGTENNTSMPTSPLVLIKKPPGSADPYRVTLDAREINSCMPTIRVESPITRECLQQLGGHKYYWKADMIDYFFQFRVSSELANYYAFSTHRGNYRFKNILPQGDKNSPPWTTNAMQHILTPLRNEVINYVDDFSGGANNATELCDKLERFLQLMHSVNAKFSTEKIFVGFDSVEFIGFIVDKDGYRPKENQLHKFTNAPFPTREKLRSWLGLLNTFRDFIPNLHEVEAAFSNVRKKNAPWVVTDDMKRTFEVARQAVANITILSFPSPDKDLYIDADASDRGCGAILYQLADDGETRLPIRFMSHTFTTAALKWSTIEKECYALVRAFNTFEYFLFGREFKVRTDHRNLIYMQRSCNAKVQRWFGYLMLFDFVIEHIPGIRNVVADAMSRVLAVMAQMTPDEEWEENAREIEQQETADPTWTPTQLQELFNRFHNGVTGHLSLANTLKAMKNVCDAPHLKQQVIRLMSTCAPCEKARKERIKPQLEYHTTSSFRPFETVQADFLTGIGKSDKGFDCILVFTCTFTRYTMLYPCVNQTALSVANNLLHLWGIFGSIKQMTSDGAPCFTSKLVTDVCRLLRIKQVITSSHNPGSHGIVENRNKEIQKIARKVYLDIAGASEKNWEVYIPLVQRILNAQSNAATGFSPYHMVFGTMVTQDLKALEDPPFDIASIKDPDKFVRELDNTLNIIVSHGLASVEDRIMKNYLRQPESNITFDVGDFVLMPNHRARSLALGKFSPQLVGPLRVVKNFNNDFYELRDLVQDEPVFAHGCDLRIFKCTNDQKALEIAALDDNEITIQSVISHEGDPAKLGQLYFVVTFTDDPTVTVTLPYKEVKYVQLVRDYITRNKRDLHIAAADLRKRDEALPPKRITRISQTLKDMEY